MSPNLQLWQFIGFAFTIFAGTLLHFVYDWTNQSIFVAPLSAVNESIWEHMKLFFFPAFLFALVQSRFFVSYNSFWCVKLIGIFSGVILIPIIFYSYSGILGKTYDWVNIGIFVIASLVSFWLELKLLHSSWYSCRYPWMALASICAIGFVFMVLTFIPPHIPLFQDPISGGYGIKTRSRP